MDELYQDKDQSYYSGVRNDVVRLVPDGPNRVLELGCSKGYTLLKIKEAGKARELVGIDIMEEEASHRGLDAYFTSDGGTLSIDYPPGYFDVIICADVLEHLINPWQTVQTLHHHLKEGGMLIASIPNIRYYGILLKIVGKGDFAYASDGGILDNTHLRFFCKKNMLDLFEVAGFTVAKIQFKLPFIKKVLNLVTFGIFEQFFVKQYLLVARKR